MRSLILLFSLLVFTSCSITLKKDGPKTNPKNIELTEAERQKKAAEEARQKILLDPKNWQHQYYEQVIFKVKNPKIIENNKQLEAVCGGSDIEFKESYQLKSLSYVKYKKYPISIKAPSGFSKKVHVPKGVCRELSLYKQKQNAGLRKKIKEMNLMYIYNVGTYLIDITFTTKFSDVEIFVK